MYKFKSRVTGDLIMLEPNGRLLLKIIDKLDADTPGKGILLPEDMPAAILALEKAIIEEEQKRKLREEDALQAGEALPAPEGISLRLRVLPFIDMAKRCMQANKEIVWGV
jgi:hypothetical protein